MTATQADTVAELQRANAELRRERDAALAREATLSEALAQRNSEFGERIEHQTATVDVLKTMSASPGDARPVFELIVERARSFCGADHATAALLQDDMLHLQAYRGMSAAYGADYEAQFPRPVDMSTMFGRAILSREVMQTGNLRAERDHFARQMHTADFHSVVAVPILREGTPIGAIALGRKASGGFSDSQIELLKTFAEQAVIAITSAETYRALQTRTSDLQETLEYQTATSDVLKVISRSAFDLQPVLDTVVEMAARLCDADQAAMALPEGDFWQLSANIGFPAEYEAYYRATGAMPYGPDAPTVTARAVREKVPVHIHDVAAIPGYPDVSIRLGKQRTSLAVPLLREGQSIGVILLGRQRVEPFTDRQIELVRTFADQAVIAIENTRLITEQREALERQTATAEVLRVINGSPGELTPVFDTILEKAHRICGATIGSLILYDGECLRAAATHGFADEFADQIRQPFRPAGRYQRLIDGERFVQAMPVDAISLRQAEVSGVRTTLAVPLRKDNVFLGAITAHRTDVRSFDEKEIVLLENFASQAVIAMDNARLLTEQREALEQQTATAEVLQVINTNPGDLMPVFDAILDKAHTLCGAVIGSLVLFDGTYFRAVATHCWPASITALFREPTGPNRARQSLVDGERFVQVADIRAIGREPNSAWGDALVESTEARTMLLVPLRKDGALLGFISAFRPEVRAFSDKEIALLENFAAQAVIAMENARLLTEQREALEQQTATAEVLQVINGSPGDLTPVFDAMLEKAMRLCGVAFGMMTTFDGERFHPIVWRGLPAALSAYFAEGGGPSISSGMHGRLVDGAALAHVVGMKDEEAYRSGYAARRALVDLGGAQTGLAIALRKDDALLGTFMLYRQEIRPFTDKQIALLQNFAAQAVIAMENARLITGQREALEQQTATAEVLEVINASPGNLAPVFDTMLEKAMRLCEAAFGNLWTYDGEVGRLAAICGASPEYRAELMRAGPQKPEPGASLIRLVEGEPLVHIADIRVEGTHHSGPAVRRMLADRAGARTVLWVPMRKDGALLGFFTIYRTEVRPFTDKQIALLENFAAQAVIAMENARLLTEQQEALERQTATAEVLQVINASPGDLAPVFDAILEKAHSLCGAAAGTLTTYDGAQMRAVATRGGSPAWAEAVRRPRPPGSNDQQIISGNRYVEIPDLQALAPAPVDDATFRLTRVNPGWRTLLIVPLRRDDAVLGYISSYRLEVRPFSDKEISLFESFAAQAVIAMENARLLTETREALEQQTATAEVLQVINASPGNLAPVFDAMLERALHLCEAAFGVLWTYDGERIHAVALRGMRPAFAEFLTRTPHSVGPDNAHGRLLHGEPVVHIADLMDDEAYRSGDPMRRSLVELGSGRTLLAVPLRKDEAFLGDFVIYRQEVRPFSDKQIALLKNFASQAVIAMENARLLTEQREALEQQQAIAEILQAINRSPGELQPVFDILLDKAMKLCEAAFGILAVKEDEQTHTVAAHGLPPALAEWRSNHPVINAKNTLLARVMAGEPYIHTLDLKDDDLYRRGEPLRRANVDLGGARTSLYVPLTRDRDVLGTIHIYRQEVRPFNDKQIALLQNFAAQAVIAMENARLLDEIRRRQEELRVTFENMGDGVAMFDETPRLVAWNRKFQQIFDVPAVLLEEHRTYADYIRYLAERGDYGPGADAEEQVRRITEVAGQHRMYERIRPDGRVIEIRHNPVAGGGFVLIYADITERKRSEAEIRAARDAAEEASRTIEAAYRDLKAAQANLIQAEKMASLGQLTAGIAHEIKNPLNFVNNFSALSTELIDELRDILAPEPLGETARTEVDDLTALLKGNLEKVVQHGQRADGIVRSMLDHSRGSSGERRMVDLNALIDEALNLAYHGARAQDQGFNITLERDFGEGIAPIEVNPQDITRVFLNLFSNGFYATTGRARDGGDAGFVPTLKVTTIDAGEAVEIRVRDNGTGIPADIRDKLFQPFFTTKPTGEGTGLGLSITYDIVTQQHGGSIAVDSEVGDYSEFTIRLPRKT